MAGLGIRLGLALTSSLTPPIVPAAPALTLQQKGLPAMFFDGTMPVSYVEATPGVITTSYSKANFITTGTMYYASTTGSDTNDGLSPGSAFRTAQKFIDTAPTNSRCTFGAGNFGPAAVPTAKALSVIGIFGQTSFGEILTNADVTLGALSNGIQTATLTSGAVSGFVDLTKFDRADVDGRPLPQVSQVATTLAEITSRWRANVTGTIEQTLYSTALNTAAPLASVFRSTPSSVSTSDQRDMTGKIGTEILMWRDTAVAPVTVVGTGKLYAENIMFIGGARSSFAAASQIYTHDCRFLGTVVEPMGCDATAVFYGSWVRGCNVPGSDGLDYTSSGAGQTTAVEIKFGGDRVNGTGGDNSSTFHGGRGLRFNCWYLDAARAVNDVNNTLLAQISCTFRGGTDVQARSLAFGGSNMYCADNRIIPGSGADMMFTTYPTAGAPSQVLVFDNSLDGKSQSDSTAGVSSNLFPTKRLTARPSDDKTFLDLDISMAGCFTDLAGTTNVTAVGDTVKRVRNLVDATEYVTFPTGTVTYQLDGARPVLRCVGATMALFMRSQFDENTNLHFAVKSSDTDGYIMRSAATGSTNAMVQVNLTTAPTIPATVVGGGFNTSTRGFCPVNQVITVDGSTTPITSGNAFRAAAYNGAPHVIEFKNADLSWNGWARCPAALFSFDGDIYAWQKSRGTTDPARRARLEAIAARAGVTPA